MSNTGRATLNSQLLTMNTLAASLEHSSSLEGSSIRPIEPKIAMAAVRQDVFSAVGIDNEFLDQLVLGSRRDPKTSSAVAAAVTDAIRPHFDTWFTRLMDGSLPQDEPLDTQQLLIAAGFNIVDPKIAMRVFSQVMDRSQQQPVIDGDRSQYISASSYLHGAAIDLDGMDSTFWCHNGTKLVPWDDGSQGFRGVDISWHTLMFNTGAGGVHIDIETFDPLVFRGIRAVFEARLKSEEPVIDRQTVGVGHNQRTVENRVSLEPALDWLTGLKTHLGFDISYLISSKPAFKVRNGIVVLE